MTMAKKGTLLIISGPSGSGKGTIVRELIMDAKFALSISVTTRKPRQFEEEGVHYFFKTKEEFERLISEKRLLEWAEFVGNYYGTPRDYVDEMLCQGKNVILEIEVKGALQVKKAFPESVLIFVVPPCLSELRRRLVSRRTESPEDIEKRINKAKEEILLVGHYDYLVVNDSIFTAVQNIMNIVSVEPLRVSRNDEMIERIKGEILNA